MGPSVIGVGAQDGVCGFFLSRGIDDHLVTGLAHVWCVSALRHAKGFRDLAVYQRADRVAAEIFSLTKQFPREEVYSLTDQIRRSSRSIGAQVAEAWGKRRYQRSFIAKLVDADAEQLETHTGCAWPAAAAT